MRRDAVLSSRIEGTRATLSDILIDEAQAGVRHGDDAEVSGREWGQLHVARPILAAIDSPLKA